jgi:hypothetical protein
MRTPRPLPPGPGLRARAFSHSVKAWLQVVLGIVFIASSLAPLGASLFLSATFEGASGSSQTV